MIGISRQGHFKRILKRQRQETLKHDLLARARVIRREHHRMGCRKLYAEINPEGIGRDKAESILLDNGFRVPRKRSYHRTTYPGGRFYRNAIEDLKLTDSNQLWVSDITYLSVGYKKNNYLTLIMDVYSRKIKGWSLSKNMTAEQTVIKAYLQAIKQVPESERTGLIFHSDKGSQYGCNQLEALHQKHDVKPSMGGKAWENPHAESLNGIIKGEYLCGNLSMLNFNELTRLIKTTIEKYNKKRPHGSIKNRKPEEYELFLSGVPQKERPTLVLNY